MPITIPAQPFTFASESGNQPAAQLDSSFANIRTALTGIALQASDLIGSYGLRGFNGTNNAGTPNSKYDMVADLVVLRAPGGGLNVQTNTGTLTNDVGLAGSAAGVAEPGHDVGADRQRDRDHPDDVSQDGDPPDDEAEVGEIARPPQA